MSETAEFYIWKPVNNHIWIISNFVTNSDFNHYQDQNWEGISQHDYKYIQIFFSKPPELVTDSTWDGIETISRRNREGISLSSDTFTDVTVPESRNWTSRVRLLWTFMICNETIWLISEHIPKVKRFCAITFCSTLNCM